MKIKTITRQHRRDFYAIYECEGCGATMESSGYDDRNFHDNVIPKMVCEKCGKSTISMGGEVERTATRYPEGYQV